MLPADAAPALHHTKGVRFLIFVFGIALGIASTLVYAAFATPSPVRVAAPLESDPQLSITLGQPIVAELVQRAIAEAPEIGKQPKLQVSLRDGAIAVAASVEVLGRRGSGTALLRPIIEKGKLRLAIESTSLGTLELPVVSLLETRINSRIGAINPTLSGMPLTFTGVRIDETGLTVTGRVDLAAVEVAR